MGKSLGTIEVVGLSSAIVVADAMAKTANIEINDLEITKGFGFVTVKIFGDVGAVKAAISAGKSLALQSGAYVASNVIARPNMDLEKRILSFKEKKEEPKKEEVKEEPKVEEKVENTSENTEKPIEKKEEVKDTKEEVKPEAKEDKKVENEQIKEEIKETKSQSSSSRRRKTTTNKVTNENNNSNK
ncbi:BMC domain-containing protein [Peptacetobacter sp.]|uniref:BMC domain-containing protein n=1 Tax=unclassified Peptacetobacter TaxID=2991974 RepID=UPI002E763445|nr:BMC domain-containing protein [Peptacetobacter sp.]MEE0451743.1 BMC domain-containing protein [Peptacetobacter sp.]